MRNLQRDSIDFGRMNIPSLFCRIFFPTLTGLIFNALLTVADGIFVGRGVGSDGLAAVNIIAPLFMIVTGIGLMFGIGGSIVAGIHLAKGNAKAAGINVTQAFGAAFLLTLLFTAAAGAFHPQVTRLLGCSDRLLPQATGYLAYLLPGCLFLVLQCVGMMLIRLDGSPKYAMMCNVIPALLNIVLDWLFVFPLGWGIEGAAAATSIGTTVGGAMALGYFLRRARNLKPRPLKPTRTSLLLTCRNVGYMIRLGASAFLNETAMSVMMLTGNYVFMREMGEEGVAAYSIVCYLFPLVFMLSNAVAQSAQPIISFNHGAENRERVRVARQTSLAWGAACGSAATLLLILFARPVAGLFLDPAYEAYALAAHGIPLFATCAICFALNIVFIGYYQSVEQPRRATLYTCLRGIVLLVPAFLVLPALAGGDGAWLAIPAAEAATLAVIVADRLLTRSARD